MTIEQRDQVRQWIKICRIRCLSNRQTTDYVNSHLPNGLSITLNQVERYIAELKQESRNWIAKISLDVYEYVDQLKERWDCIKELMRIQWEELDKARQNNDADNQAKASLLLCKLNDQLLEMVSILPQIALPSFPNTVPSQTISLPNTITSKAIFGPEDVENGNGHNKEETRNEPIL